MVAVFIKKYTEQNIYTNQNVILLCQTYIKKIK